MNFEGVSVPFFDMLVVFRTFCEWEATSQNVASPLVGTEEAVSDRSYAPSTLLLL